LPSIERNGVFPCGFPVENLALSGDNPPREGRAPSTVFRPLSAGKGAKHVIFERNLQKTDIPDDDYRRTAIETIRALRPEKG
jgi:hypothetical protein